MRGLFFARGPEGALRPILRFFARVFARRSEHGALRPRAQTVFALEPGFARAPGVALRPVWLLASSLCAVALVACAEGGLSDEELNAAQGSDDDGENGGKGSGATANKDGGTKKDGGAADDDSETGSSSRDGGKASTSRDGGGSSLPTIKCPSNMVCTSDISFLLSTLDPSVKASTLVCAQSGILPMPLSCKSDDDCERARLTSGTCKGSYCIQACSK